MWCGALSPARLLLSSRLVELSESRGRRSVASSSTSPLSSLSLSLHTHNAPRLQGNAVSKNTVLAIAAGGAALFAAQMMMRRSGGDGAKFAPWPAHKHSSKESAQSSKWRAAGLEAVRNGEVGAILLAGGQGSRLGFNSPKGEYNFGLWSGKTLFQLHAERLLRLQTLAGGSGKIVLYVMTSPSTDAATQAAFKRNGYYGMEASQVVFFAQSELPCVTMGEFVPRESEADSAMYTTDGATTIPDDVDADLKVKFASQSHVFMYWGELSAAEKATFQTQLRDVVDVERVERIYKATCAGASGGKIILADKGLVAMAPDGNGGIYPALLANGVIDDMESRGVKYLPQLCVDNALVQIAEPTFVGYCVSEGAKVGSRAAVKQSVSEKVGVFVERTAGKGLDVVEYSELETADASATLADGSFKYGLAHICLNYFSLSFLKEIVREMPTVYHIAKKEIGYVTADGVALPKGDVKNKSGIKLESFIFDVFHKAGGAAAILDVDRKETFAPIKNSPYKAAGHSDSPNSARVLFSDIHGEWIAKALSAADGAAFTAAAAEWTVANPLLGAIEISPLVSYGGEGLEDLAAVGAKLATMLPLCVVTASESEQISIALAPGAISAWTSIGDRLEVATVESATPRLSTNAGAGGARAWPDLSADVEVAATAADKAEGRLTVSGGAAQSAKLYVLRVTQ